MDLSSAKLSVYSHSRCGLDGGMMGGVTRVTRRRRERWEDEQLR